MSMSTQGLSSALRSPWTAQASRSPTEQPPPGTKSRPLQCLAKETHNRCIVVAAVRKLHEQGAELYLWSSGGGEYARASASELGIMECFVAFLPKPHTYIDDQPVHEWRFCRHVLPGNAQDA
jgi:hypothetical protein